MNILSVFLSLLPVVLCGSPVPDGVVSLSLVRKQDYSAYMTKLRPGTPPQEEFLLVDTGSPTISFENPKNNVCSIQQKPCALYGVFENTTSSTCKWISNAFNDELIDFGSGSVLEDVVEIGGVSVSPLRFGYIDDYGFGLEQVAVPTATILGLALRCDINKLDESCYKTGYFLVPQLYEQKRINYRAASFYLGPEEFNVTNSEALLGGVYDKAKQVGQAFEVPMAFYNSETNSVNASAISSTINGKVTRIELNPRNTSLLDTGNPMLTIPEPFWNQTMAALGNPNQKNNTNGRLVVDCKYRNIPATDKLSYEFGSPENKIDVPLNQLVIDLGDGTCGADIGSGGPISNGIGPLGDPFIRQAYLTFDFEKFTVTMAQARFTSDRDIVPLAPMGYSSK